MLLILNFSYRPLRYSLLLLLARITYYSVIRFEFWDPPIYVAVSFLRVLILLFWVFYDLSGHRLGYIFDSIELDPPWLIAIKATGTFSQCSCHFCYLSHFSLGL